MRVLPLLALFACGGPPDMPEGPLPQKIEEPSVGVAPVDEATAVADRTATVDAEGWQAYGEAFTVTETVALSTVAASAESFDGKTVRVSGQITDVCQKKGCWLVLTEGEQTMRIMTKDHAFGIEMGATGWDAELEGRVYKKEPNPEHAKHFESEAKDPSAAPEGEGQVATWEIEATAIRIKPKA